MAEIKPKSVPLQRTFEITVHCGDLSAELISALTQVVAEYLPPNTKFPQDSLCEHTELPAIARWFYERYGKTDYIENKTNKSF